MGIIGWLAYNWVIFGDPLIFFYGRFYGAGPYYSQLLYTLLHPWTADYFAIDSVVSGPAFPVVLVLAPLGLVNLVLKGRAKRVRGVLAYLALVLPPLTLFLIASEGLLIFDTTLYFYFLTPRLVLYSFLGVEALSRTPYVGRFLAAMAAVAILASFVAVSFAQYGILHRELIVASPTYLSYRVSVANALAHLRPYGGLVLSPLAPCSIKLSFLGDASPSVMVDEYDGDMYRELTRCPWRHGEVVAVLIPYPELYESMKDPIEYLGGSGHYAVQFYENSTWREEFLSHFVKVGDVGGEYMVYQRVG